MPVGFHVQILLYPAGYPVIGKEMAHYGKIKVCMPETNPEIKIEPPKLIPSLVEGFNAIASHIYIILFPILIDLMLWFGPLVRIKELVLPVVLRATEVSASAYGQDSASILQGSKEVWTALLDEFNILFNIRTYPIGVPSLLIGKGVTQNPLGSMQIIEMGSVNNALYLILALSVAGIILGCLYFSLIAWVTSESKALLRISQLANNIGQSVILSIVLMIALMILAVPASCFISSVLLFLPSLGSLPYMVLILVLVWMILPLVFSPHGIFADQQKAGAAIVTSIRMVRSLMSTTGTFLIMLILLGYGLDYLWSTPGANSWMLLVGIAGHAFISSGLIAASFVYYKKGVIWMRESMHKVDTIKQKTIS
jgi:hypothetical protein